MENQRAVGEQILRRLKPSFQVDWVTESQALRAKSVQRVYGLLILGTDLSEEQRFESLREHRRLSPHTMVFVLTDSATSQKRVKLLEAGADDVMVRPFHMEEFVARIKLLTRRAPLAALEGPRAGELSIDSGDGGIYCAGARVDLPRAERNVLSMMIRRTGRVVTKDMIEESLGDQAALSSNAIEQRVSRLRRVLENARANVQIRTVRGSGYVLEPARPVRVVPVAERPVLPDIPEDLRRALWLVLVDGRSYREAAAQLGIPLQELMGRLCMAREHLRALLNREELQARAEMVEGQPGLQIPAA